MAKYPALKASELERLMMREPLNYRVERQKGSHRIMRARGLPQILFSYHAGATVPPHVVRKILVKDIGLTDEQALRVLGRQER